MRQDIPRKTDDSRPQMRLETRERLLFLLYHPRHSSSPDMPLDYARECLGRQDVVQKDILALPENEAAPLADALERAFPDRTAGLASRVTQEFADRL